MGSVRFGWVRLGSGRRRSECCWFSLKTTRNTCRSCPRSNPQVSDDVRADRHVSNIQFVFFSSITSRKYLKFRVFNHPADSSNFKERHKCCKNENKTRLQSFTNLVKLFKSCLLSTIIQEQLEFRTPGLDDFSVWIF